MRKFLKFCVFLLMLVGIGAAVVWYWGRSRYPPDLVSEGPRGPTTDVTAKSVGIVVDGAIICRNEAQVSGLFSLYNHAWSEQFEDKLSGGQTTLLRGKAAATPDPTDYGCVLVPPGTPMKKENQPSLAPIVNVTMEDGTQLRGVTFPDMIQFPNQAPPFIPMSPSQPSMQPANTPIETPVPTTDEAATPAPSPVLQPQTTPAAQFTWRTLPNGNETLSGPEGLCATISFQQLPSPAIQLNLEDGLHFMFDISDSEKAVAAANQHCLHPFAAN